MDVNNYRLLESNEFWERVGQYLKENEAKKDSDNKNVRDILSSIINEENNESKKQR